VKKLFYVMFALIIAGIVSVVLVGCEKSANTQSADEVQRQQTAQLQQEATGQVGMPGITNFAELKAVKQIIEARDSETVTYTYTVDRSGGLHFVCQSMGFGIPYSTQMTNPEKDEWRSKRQGVAGVVKPQPEPNGLFMPDNVSATWILCLDEENSGVRPVYSEPELIVSPFELQSVSQYQVEK